MSHEQPGVASRATEPADVRIATGAPEPPSPLTDVGGTVKWFDPRKGFGFVVGPQGQDIFIHYSVISQEGGFRTLRDGESVVYSAHVGPKGWAATSVRAIAAHAARSETAAAPQQARSSPPPAAPARRPGPGSNRP